MAENDFKDGTPTVSACVHACVISLRLRLRDYRKVDAKCWASLSPRFCKVVIVGGGQVFVEVGSVHRSLRAPVHAYAYAYAYAYACARVRVVRVRSSMVIYE